MSTDDLEARERELRAKAGFDAPLQAKKKGRPRGPPPRSCAVLREDVPTHEREPPEGVTLTAPPDEHPLPRGSVIIGSVISRKEAGDHLNDGAGWVWGNPDGTRDPVPVITGKYYDGSPRLAILAVILLPAPRSDLADAIEGADL